MRAQETLYIVSDLDEAIRYYTNTFGFSVLNHHDWGYALLAADDHGGRVGLLSQEAFDREFSEDESHAYPRLSLQVADLDAEAARLREGGARIGDVSGRKGHRRAVNVYDRDGNAFLIWEDGTGQLPG
jgi:catechol 2,3-dioxygenase-like lactoylglutathione lyase family enzyme